MRKFSISLPCGDVKATSSRFAVTAHFPDGFGEHPIHGFGLSRVIIGMFDSASGANDMAKKIANDLNVNDEKHRRDDVNNDLVWFYCPREPNVGEIRVEEIPYFPDRTKSRKRRKIAQKPVRKQNSILRKGAKRRT